MSRSLERVPQRTSGGAPAVAGMVWALGLLLLLAVLAAGCGTENESAMTAPTDSSEDPDLDAPLGGFTMADEEPAFGEAELAASVESEAEFEDAVLDQETVDELIGDSNVRAFAVTLNWGVLRESTDAAESDPSVDIPAVDWSGTLQVNRGAIVLRRVLGFEDNDAIDLPRENAQTLSWTSETGADVDGLRLTVYFPGRGASQDDALEINTPLFSVRYTALELRELEVAQTFEVPSQQVRVQSFALDRSPADTGFAYGEWTPPADGLDGTFLGRWLDASGVIVGFVRGVYGWRGGSPLLFGKLIDRGGRFQGFVSGSWSESTPNGTPGGPGAAEGAQGRYEAEILVPVGGDRDELDSAGWFRGLWRAGRGDAGGPSSNVHGTFDGSWCRGCASPRGLAGIR